MTAKNIDDGKFFLIDCWPGVPTNGPNPADWTTIDATELWQLGTKRLVYDDTNNGWATLMYLKFEAGTDSACAIKSLCAQDKTEAALAAGYCVVGDVGDECNQNGPLAIALASMTDATFGWFWVGGVCPVDTISGLDGNYVTNGLAAAGSAMDAVTASNINVFGLSAANDVGVIAAYACVDDS